MGHFLSLPKDTPRPAPKASISSQLINLSPGTYCFTAGSPQKMTGMAPYSL